MKSSKYVLALLLSLVTSNLALAEDNQDEYAYIFGYGSLMSTLARTATAPDPENAEFLPVTINDVTRQWNLWMSKSQERALSLEESPGSYVNGLLFAVKKGQLPDFDKREGPGYQRVKITADKVSFYRKEHQKNVLGTRGDADIYVYLPRKDSKFYVGREGSEKKIAMSYLNIVRAGCVEVDQKNQLNGQFINDCFETLGLDGYGIDQEVDGPRYPRHPENLLNEANNKVKKLESYMAQEWPEYLKTIQEKWGF